MTQLTQVEVKEIWKQACAQLELELSSAVYNTWIVANPVVEISSNETHIVATVASPSAFHSTNFKTKLGHHLVRVLSGVLDKQVEIIYVIGDPNHTNLTNSTQSASANNGVRGFHRIDQVVGTPIGSSAFDQTPQNLTSGHFSSSSSTPSPRVEDLFSQSTIDSNQHSQAIVRARNIGLRADSTFETFAVSSTNEMAHAAATAVSKTPGTAYNPLFLYGGVGVGKTHLMHAIGHNILQRQPSAHIIYCTGEEFTNQIVTAIRNKNAIDFKNRYRTADVLLIDDVQFIAGKNTVQEEFFHTFNALTKRQSQIVLTSDRPPHEISLLESRLKSRFEAGLMIDIQQPSFELRTAILLIKAKALSLPISIDLAKMIAARVDSARKIEGILNTLRSEVELKGHAISTELVEQMLHTENTSRKAPLRVKVSEVIKTVADHYRIKQQELKGQSRKKHLALARHIAMYLCRADLAVAYEEIGRWFSHRDHTSILHAVNKVEGLLTSDPEVQQEVSAIRMSLSGLSSLRS